MWSWLEHSYYKEGVFEFKGKLVGVWTYEVCYHNISIIACIVLSLGPIPTFSTLHTDKNGGPENKITSNNDNHLFKLYFRIKLLEL